MAKQNPIPRGPYWLRGVMAFSIGGLLMTLGAHRASAEVSALDGYAPDGRHQIHVELIPYIWLLAVGSTVKPGNGAQALSRERFPGSSQAVRSATLTAYEPTFGFGITF